MRSCPGRSVDGYWSGIRRSSCMRAGVLALGLFVLPLAASAAEPPRAEKGTFRFTPAEDQKDIPERYRLAEREFAFEMQHKVTIPGLGVDVYRVQFPSPVTSPHPENNTVHAEYYRPPGKGPFPCVIVLDILDGSQRVSRTIATRLSQE